MRLWSWYSISVGMKPNNMTSEMLWFWEYLAGLWLTCVFHVKTCHVPVLADLVYSCWTKVCGRKLACKFLFYMCQIEVFSVQDMSFFGAEQGSTYNKGVCAEEWQVFPLRKIIFNMSFHSRIYRAICSAHYYWLVESCSQKARRQLRK